jgi:hypothetical protein
MVRRRHGLSLMEVLIGGALLLMAVVSLCMLLRGGYSGAAHATEMQLATIMGSQVVDGLLSDGFRGLAAVAGQEGELDLGTFAAAGDGVASQNRTLVADGFTYRARAKVEWVSDGLLRLRVVLSWERYGPGTQGNPGTMTLLRYVADPTMALDSHEPWS